MIDPIALQFSLFGLDISIHWYGIIIAVGMLLAIVLAMYRAKRREIDPDSILDLALLVIPLSIIFARLYYVTFMWNEIYANGPFWKVFAVWEGGMAIYGGVIGGFLGVWVYTLLNRKVKLMTWADLLAPCLILGQAIGRWGNFVNQEAYGYAITNPAWQWFPAAVFISADTQNPYHMATFFYESMWNFLVFAFLLVYDAKVKHKKTGDIFWFYLLLYGIGRFVIEGLRTDSLYLGGSDIRISQLLSGILVAAAAIVLVTIHFFQGRKPKEPKPLAPLDESLKLMRDEDRANLPEELDDGTIQTAPAGMEQAETETEQQSVENNGETSDSTAESNH